MKEGEKPQNIIRNSMNRNFLTGAGIVLFGIALLIFAISNKINQNQEQRISAWAADNGYQIQSIEEHQGNGPFWYKEDAQKIYRARVRDRNNHEKWVWFRIGWLLDAKEEK